MSDGWIRWSRMPTITFPRGNAKADAVEVGFRKGTSAELLGRPAPADEGTSSRPLRCGFPIGIFEANQTVNDFAGRRRAVRADRPGSMVVYFKVCIVCGFVLASPWVFWQIWSFVAAGLYPHEKKLRPRLPADQPGPVPGRRAGVRVRGHARGDRGALVVQRVAGPGAGPAAQRVARLRHLDAGDLRPVVPDAAGDAVPGPHRAS